MFCRNCGAPLAEGDLFCGECGARVAPRAVPTATPTIRTQIPKKQDPPPSSSGGIGCLGCAGIIVLISVVFGLVSWLFSLDDEDSGTERRESSQIEERPRVETNSASGGLGLTTDAWRAIYGEPVETRFDEFLDRYPGEGGYYVDIRFVTNTADGMTHINITFDPPVEPAVAEAIVADYLPADATVVREYRNDLADQPVTLYRSEWLGDTLGPGNDDVWWGDAGPGAFHALYWWQDNDLATGKISNASIALSHNP